MKELLGKYFFFFQFNFLDERSNKEWLKKGEVVVTKMGR